ncbi:MAG: DUF4129 domain-containing protein [Symbiobacterium sp.]|uniref:DUF4129 domain-containing protein n=1 Tax=Symbiobacterium sp. TaxID=1971213 RepID=UPI0034642576
MRRGIALLLLLLWLPVAAPAAAAPIPAEAYAKRLSEAGGRLAAAEVSLRRGDEEGAIAAVRAARERLEGIAEVTSAAGVAQADLSDLLDALRAAEENPRSALEHAQRVLDVHLDAAEELRDGRPITVRDARRSLDRALAEIHSQSVLVRLQVRLQDWVHDTLGRLRAWWLGLLGLDEEDVASAEELGLFAFAIVSVPVLIWAGVKVYQMLSGHGAGRDAVWRGGKGPAPERPLRPAELLARAQAAAGRGEYLEGMRTAHLALLKHFDELGLIRYHPAQTNREHEVQLGRRQPALRPALRNLHDLVDACLYAGRSACMDDYQQAEGLILQLWREGDAVSQAAKETSGGSSSASSR